MNFFTPFSSEILSLEVTEKCRPSKSTNERPIAHTSIYSVLLFLFIPLKVYC